MLRKLFGPLASLAGPSLFGPSHASVWGHDTNPDASRPDELRRDEWDHVLRTGSGSGVFLAFNAFTRRTDPNGPA